MGAGGEGRSLEPTLLDHLWMMISRASSPVLGLGRKRDGLNPIHPFIHSNTESRERRPKQRTLARTLPSPSSMTREKQKHHSFMGGKRNLSTIVPSFIFENHPIPSFHHSLIPSPGPWNGMMGGKREFRRQKSSSHFPRV